VPLKLLKGRIYSGALCKLYRGRKKVLLSLYSGRIVVLLKL
jgi:hypothetical protein